MKTAILRTLSPLAIAAAASSPAWAGDLTLYTALEAEEIEAYIAAAEADLPDINFTVLRLSTGDLGARLIAEANNPQADVIWGFALTNMLNPQIYDQTAPVEVEGVDQLAAQFRDEGGRWFAPIGYMGAFCVNIPRLEQIGAPMPTSWADLTNPAYAGEVVMPDPGSSGTGYLQIAAILQGMGEEAGWDFIEALDPNMAQYTTSGSRPCRMAQAGEYAIGASLSLTAIQGIDEGYPIEMVIPSDYAGFELEANAMVAGANNPEDAKRFLDWTLSESAAAVYSEHKDLVTLPGVPRSERLEAAGFPEDLSTVLFPMDFAASGEARDAILTHWRDLVGR